MADVNLVIRAHLRGERELNKAERKLLRIAVAAKAADNNMASLGASSKKFARIMNQTTERFERIMTDWDKLVKGFGTLIVKTLGMATKFMVVEFAAVAASMIVVHGLFKIGRWLMKGYHGAIKMIAGAATSAAAALAVLSAAIREQQAAMFSYKGLERNYKDLKNGISAVRSEMRGMATDVTMAALGIENMNTMFAGASQRGTFSKNLSKGLLDIASAGQPLEAAAKWVGEIVGLLTDPDIKPQELEKAFKSLGAIGERTWKKLAKEGKTSVKDVRAAIRSGLISELAGVEGQWDAVSGTLVSRFKAAFTIIRTDFADIGDAFLGDVKGSLDEMTIIFRRLMFRIRGDVIKFGKGGLLGGMVAAMEKIEENMIKLVDKWLPMAEGMFGRIADWWGRFTDGWKKVTSSLAPLLSAAKILEDMFMNILRPVGDYLSESFNSLRIFLIDSKKDFLAHGTAIGDLLTALLGFKTAWTEMFQDAMPFINKLIDGVTQLVDLFTSVTKGVGGFVTKLGNVGQAVGGGAGGSGGSGGFGPFLMMMGMMQGFKAMRGTEGTWREKGLDLQNLNTMTVTAGTVNVNGASAGGTVGGRKAMSEYGYAPSQAVIHGKAPGSIGAGAGAVGLAGAAAGAGGIVKRRIPARDRQLFGATDYATADRYRRGPPGQGVWKRGAGRGTGYTSPNEQLSIYDELNKPQYDARMWHGGQMRDPVTGRMLPTPSPFQAGTAEAGSLFGPGIGAAAPGSDRGFVEPGFSRTARAANWEEMQKRQGAGGLGAFLGGGYGKGTGGEGKMDFSQMTPKQLKMMVSANPTITMPDGRVETNPFYGPSAGQSLGSGIRGKMPWKGEGGVGANLKAAWRREKMMSTTRITGGPVGPQTAYQRRRTNVMRRLGAGSARGEGIQRRLGSKAGFGMRMGMGMGMGVASGFMGEEAQGAMNLGSSIAMINPLLGAAVGLGGAALKSQTVGGGMLTGAGAGAALGGMIGPGGAVVGAIVGGIIGGVMGHFGKAKAARAEVKASARDTASEIWGGMISGIDEARAEGGPMTAVRMRRAMNVGQMSNILQSGKAALAMGGKGEEGAGFRARQTAIQSIYENREMLGVDMSMEERDKALKLPFDFLDEMLPEITKHHGVANVVLNKYTNRMEHMTDMFSVSEEELLKMADTVGVNLYDATESTTEMMKKLSGALMQTRDDINNVFQAIMNTTYDAFSKAAGVYTGEIGMDESARAFKEMADSGELDTSTAEGKEAVLNFLTEQMGFATDLAGGDIMAATSMINDLYGEGKAFTQVGGSMEGLGGFFQDPLIQATLADQMDKFEPAKIETLTQHIIGNLMGQGLQGTFSGDFSSVMAGMSGDTRNELTSVFESLTALERGTNMRDDEGDLTALGVASLQANLDRILGVGTVRNLVEAGEGRDTAALTDVAMATFAATFGESVGTFETSVQDLVAKLDTGDTKHPFGDTSSAMAGTLAAHGRISGGLPGKRTITSGYRNYALGSSNSDHVTGRALDLVGDNLGAYQRGIKSGGGYAEFHGMGDSRHLHAVPAIGDTSTSQGGMGTSNTSNYTINVTGGPNANAQEVASLVMNEIQNLQRTNRERS
jgi:hypothetical protein